MVVITERAIQDAFAQGQTDRVREPLAERTGGSLDSCCMVIFRMTGIRSDTASCRAASIRDRWR
jgi:hypothetical protein